MHDVDAAGGRLERGAAESMPALVQGRAGQPEVTHGHWRQPLARGGGPVTRRGPDDVDVVSLQERARHT
jgi:hypothetical protein